MGRYSVNPATKSQRALEQALTTEKLLKLVIKGKNVRQAADELGMRYTTALRYYHDALQQTFQESATMRQQVLGKELRTLEYLQQALWPAASRGHVRSVEAMLSVMDRRAKYLGLDAAIKVQVDATRIDEALTRIGRIIDADAIEVTPLLRPGTT